VHKQNNNMELKHTTKLNALPENEKALASALYEAFAASAKLNPYHKTQKHIQQCLGMVVTDATEVRLNIQHIKEQAREETNPKRAVALLQSQPVAAKPQEAQEGPNPSEIPNNSTQEANEPQSEQPKGKKKRRVAGAKKVIDNE